MENSKISQLNLLIRNFSGDEFSADVHFVEKYLPAPVVIYSHGFLGFKDWGFIPYTANKFAEAGFVFVRFNFSHNGVDKNGKKITEYEKLARNTISKQIEDISAVVDEVAQGEIKVFCDGKIFLLGHSGGGGISIIKAREDKRINALALWATISTFRRHSRKQINEWIEKGHIYIRVPDSEIKIRMDRIIYDDFIQNQERYDILKAFSELKIPILIVHGSADAIVSPSEAEELHKANPEFSKLVIINGANHMFNTVHPFRETSQQFEEILQHTISFFSELKTKIKD